MRLIDAEPLEQKLKEEYDELFNAYGIEAIDEFTDGIRTATHCDLGYIKTAPTVEAISVEWLEKRLSMERRPTVRNWLIKLMRDWREEQNDEQ